MATISIIFTAERRHFVGNKCGIPEDVAGNNIYRYDLHTDETTLLTTTRSSANQTCSSTNGRYGFPIVYGTPDNRNEGVEGPVVLDLIEVTSLTAYRAPFLFTLVREGLQFLSRLSLQDRQVLRF